MSDMLKILPLRPKTGMFKKTIIYLSALLMLLQSCSDKEQKIDVSNIKIDLTTRPFYADFASLDTNDFGNGLSQLHKKYPDFLDFYLDTLLPFNKVNGDYNDPERTANIRNILVHKDYAHLIDTVNKVFPDTKLYDEQIGDMLKRTKHFFPQWLLPTKVTYFVSCLNRWTAFTHQNTIGIGLDMFLGQNFRPYEAISLPHYALINHTPENIPMWAAKAVYQDNFEAAQQNMKDLVGLMIANGKERLFLERVLPDLKFNLIMGCTPEQLQWCEANEALIFNLFMQQNLLFSKDFQQIMRYVTPGPNSAGFPPEAPGNLGTFIGYKILSTYAERTGSSLAEILNEQDANLIFQRSNYKP